MIDKTSMMNSNISALARQAADTLQPVGKPDGAAAFVSASEAGRYQPVSGWPAGSLGTHDRCLAVCCRSAERVCMPEISNWNRFGQSHGHAAGFFSWISDDPECPKQALSAYKDIKYAGHEKDPD